MGIRNDEAILLIALTGLNGNGQGFFVKIFETPLPSKKIEGENLNFLTVDGLLTKQSCADHI